MLLSLAIRVFGAGTGLVGFARLAVRVLEVGFVFTMADSIDSNFVRCNKKSRLG
jgi:hypothetical protein